MVQKELSDETLVAYVDGALKKHETASLREREISDAAFRARAESYRRLRAAVSDAYRADLEEPVPPRLLAAAHAGPRTAPMHRGSAGVARRWLRPAAALAASLILGIAIGRMGPDADGPDAVLAAHPAGPVAAGALAAMLESRPSGGAGPSGNRILLSYARVEGGYCRVFTLGGGDLSGLACRTADGWAIEALEPAEAQDRRTGMRPAGAKALPSTVRVLVERHKMGDPLGAEEEARALRRGWTRAGSDR